MTINFIYLKDNKRQSANKRTNTRGAQKWHHRNTIQRGRIRTRSQYLPRYPFVLPPQDRRGYQRDTAPEPLGGERTIAIMTDLQNNSVHRIIIVILPLIVRTANQDTLNSFNNCSKGISNFATDSQVNRSHWLTLYEDRGRRRRRREEER